MDDHPAVGVGVPHDLADAELTAVGHQHRQCRPVVRGPDQPGDRTVAASDRCGREDLRHVLERPRQLIGRLPVVEGDRERRPTAIRTDHDHFLTRRDNGQATARRVSFTGYAAESPQQRCVDLAGEDSHGLTGVDLDSLDRLLD